MLNFPLYLWYVHVTLIHQWGKFTEHRLQSREFDTGSVVRHQRRQTRQRAELQGALVFPQERSQHWQSFRQDGRQLDLGRGALCQPATKWPQQKQLEPISPQIRTFIGAAATRATVLTAVSLVISFFNLSRKIDRIPGSSVPRWSPRWHTMWPIQVMARSFTSWSMSVAFSLFKVTANTWEKQTIQRPIADDRLLTSSSKVKVKLKNTNKV